ncbi:MAG: hypothetical protein IRZ20_06485, partial [Thermoleophilia bacterium]|nr:hypothetical protein [Thermoleophilia bacterium]
MLALLVLAQWSVVAWVASAAHHSGWLYGDPAETQRLHEASRAILHGHLSQNGGGFLWPVLTAPFAAVGASPSAGLAALVLVQVVVLLPLALLSLVGAAACLAGRTLGAFAGAVWIVLPLLGYRFFDVRMRPAVRDGFLPAQLGLAETTLFPTMVALAVAGYLLVRALGSGSAWGAASAGLAASVALALSGSALVFVPGLLCALALRRRPLPIGAAACALLPGLVAFGLWHAHAPAAEAPLLHFDWSQFHGNLLGFREYGWSLRVVEWVPIAGTIALLRRSLTAAVGVASWFWLGVLLRGAVPDTFATGDPFHPSSAFLTLLLPAFPAFVLLVAALPLLVPR